MMPRWSRPRRLNKTPAELLAYAREQGFALRLDPNDSVGLRIGGNPPTVFIHAIRAAKMEIVAMLKNADTATAVLGPVEQGRVDRWVRSRIVSWAPTDCFGCRRKIGVGEPWLDVVGDPPEYRARFHKPCYDAWRAEQELAARKALGL